MIRADISLDDVGRAELFGVIEIIENASLGPASISTVWRMRTTICGDLTPTEAEPGHAPI